MAALPRYRKTLRDGSRVLIRPIDPGDKQALAGAFDRLSEQSRYRRFFTAVPALTDAQLVALTEVDHRDHGTAGVSRHDGSQVELLIELPRARGIGANLARALRAAASGGLVSAGTRRL
jgi:hypothetical protein